MCWNVLRRLRSWGEHMRRDEEVLTIFNNLITQLWTGWATGNGKSAEATDTMDDKGKRMTN